MAGSMMSGLLVAPMMKTFFFEDMPSISVRTWLMTLSAAPPGREREGGREGRGGEEEGGREGGREEENNVNIHVEGGGVII